MPSTATAKISLLITPYSSIAGRSLVQFLVDELKSNRWSRFSAAVAFVKHSGNSAEFVQALTDFAKNGNTVELTFGANTFGPESASSEYEAVELLLKSLENMENSRIFLYHDGKRTFHPKVYLFDNEKARTALLIIGSSNWTDGGLRDNVEANIVVELDTSTPDHSKLHQELREYFERYWQEITA